MSKKNIVNWCILFCHELEKNSKLTAVLLSYKFLLSFICNMPNRPFCSFRVTSPDDSAWRNSHSGLHIGITMNYVTNNIEKKQKSVTFVPWHFWLTLKSLWSLILTDSRKVLNIYIYNSMCSSSKKNTDRSNSVWLLRNATAS